MILEDEAIKLKKIAGIMIICPQTDFTISLEKTMDDIYQDLCEKDYKKILFEFLPKNNITSGGMAILFGLIRDSQKRNQEIGVTGLSKHFEKTFRMVGITRYVTIYNSMEEALRKMSQPGPQIPNNCVDERG
jgi:anti-anti-sigma regulatory factor